MAQVYTMMLGTSGKQWELLTVRDNGTMTMTFHGTDREICHEVTENEDGWLCYPGAMYPGLQSGKWQVVEAQPVVEAQTAQQQLEPVVVDTKPKRHRKERKQRKPATRIEPVRRNVITESRNYDTAEPTSDNGWLRSAGYLAAASVALFVIYETGLLIPLGLIGLATSGLLK